MTTTFAKGQRVITSEDSGSQGGRVTDITMIGDRQHVSITWDNGEQVWFTAEMLDIVGTRVVHDTTLTSAATRLLAEVNAKGTVRKNGRMFNQAQQLKNAGLCNVDFDLVIPDRGSSLWVITLTAKEEV